MDLLSSEAAEDIFEATIDWALQKQMRLLITHPSDLFQIKPENVKLFVHVQMTPMDLTLVGCQKASSLYLCKQNDILHCDFKTTCLGAVYDQDYDPIMELCPLTFVL